MRLRATLRGFAAAAVQLAIIHKKHGSYSLKSVVVCRRLQRNGPRGAKEQVQLSLLLLLKLATARARKERLQ